MKKLLFLFFVCLSQLYAEDPSVGQLQARIKAAIIRYYDFPKPGIAFDDISPILEDPDLFSAIIDHFVERYSHVQLDAVAALDARGFLFGSALAYRLKLPLVMIRKEGKLPGDVYKATYKKLYGEDVFVMRKEALKKGTRVVIVDDFISTGGSARAAGELIQSAGGEVYEGLFLLNDSDVPYKLALNFPIFFLVNL